MVVAGARRALSNDPQASDALASNQGRDDSDQGRDGLLVLPVDQPMQFGVLHVAQDPAGVVELSVVEVSQGGQSLDISGAGAELRGAVAR